MESTDPLVCASDVRRVRDWPLLRLGFRPFYLGAASFAAIAIPLWIAMFLGVVQLPLALSPMIWHAHEMMYGFVIAVIIGFLLTAGKAWTGLATPRGGHLAVLALLWLSARLAAVLAPYGVYAFLDAVLLPWVAGHLTVLLIRSGNHRNLQIAAILWLLALANVVFHLAVLQIVQLPPLRVVHAALALVVVMECVMAGRVIPAFTMSATPELKLSISPALERATLATTALGLASWIFLPESESSALLLVFAAVLQVSRQWQWKPWVTRTRPILWVLQAAYIWLPIGLVLLALAQLGWVNSSAGLHALAIGLTGGLIIGMMTRTARGHTGRPIHASRGEVWAYALVLVAATVRVLVPFMPAQWLAPVVVFAAACWAIAFATYLFVYIPWLMRARLDAKDG
jgi:uncharacterized protein involved in response to NO